MVGEGRSTEIPRVEININRSELNGVIENFLSESSRFNVDCLDLKDALAEVIMDWFEEYKTELTENFKNLYPQTFQPKQELLERMRPALPLERIRVGEGVGLEFRRTKIVDNWVSDVYDKLLKPLFRKR